MRTRAEIIIFGLGFALMRATVPRSLLTLQAHGPFRQGRGADRCSATVPGVVCSAGLPHGLAEDPFFGAGESAARPAARRRGAYRKTFEQDPWRWRTSHPGGGRGF